MQGKEVLIAMLVAGSVALSGGFALAATAESKAPEAAKTPAVSAPATTPMSKEATETKAVQQTEKKTEQQADKTETKEKVAKEKEKGSDRIIRGEVTAVEPATKMLSIKGMVGKKEETLGIEVPDTAKIVEGKTAKTMADIKVGDKVWMKYDHMSNKKLIADEIRLGAPQKAAATKKSS